MRLPFRSLTRLMPESNPRQDLAPIGRNVRPIAGSFAPQTEPRSTGIPAIPELIGPGMSEMGQPFFLRKRPEILQVGFDLGQFGL